MSSQPAGGICLYNIEELCCDCVLEIQLPQFYEDVNPTARMSFFKYPHIMKHPPASWKLADHEGPLVVNIEHFSLRSKRSSHLWNLMWEQHRPFRITLVTVQSKSVSMSFKTPWYTTMLFSVIIVLFFSVVFSCLDGMYYGVVASRERPSPLFFFFSPPFSTCLETCRDADRYRKWTLEIKASKPILALDVSGESVVGT